MIRRGIHGANRGDKDVFVALPLDYSLAQLYN
jgi:hypothetical protein